MSYKNQTDWKKYLRALEEIKEWDFAIDFMKGVIKENPDNKDAYMFMNYLLMNLLVEEDFDREKEYYYRTLTKQYFDESYAKFSGDAEYLYITGKTAVMGEWFFGIDQPDYEAMIEKAKQLEPDNLVYKENYYWQLSEKNSKDPELIAYAKAILSKNSPIKEQLATKGAVGEYLLMLKEYWCNMVLKNAED